MADRDTYRNYPDRWSSRRRDEETEHGWSSGGEERSFADSDAGAPFGSDNEYDRDRLYRPSAGGRRYGGQGAYGQGPSAGGYGYGRAVQRGDQISRGYDVRQDPGDYDQGGTGGYGWYGPDRRAEQWTSGGRYSRPEGEYDSRGGEAGRFSRQQQQNFGRDDYEDRYRRDVGGPSEALRRVTGEPHHYSDDHEHSYRRWRDGQLAAHDREYSRWRDDQSRRYDEDYGEWRNQRHQAFSKDFETWRRDRLKGEGKAPPTDLTVSPPEVENVTDGKKPSDDRNS